jgi:hypothetical protein
MAILPSVLHGLATYAGLLEGLMTRLFESQIRRYGAALPRPEQKPKPKFKPRDRKIATNCPPAREA